MGAVGHVAVDLDPAVHRAGVQDEEVLRGLGQPLAGDAEDPVVLPQRGQEAGLHALELEAEDVERIRPLDRVLDPREDGDAELVRRCAAAAWPGRRRPPGRPA